jgi:hypothetical protein
MTLILRTMKTHVGWEDAKDDYVVLDGSSQRRPCQVTGRGKTAVQASAPRFRRGLFDRGRCVSVCLIACSVMHRTDAGSRGSVLATTAKLPWSVVDEDIFLTINGSWFWRLALFSKSVAGVNQAFYAISRWRRRGRVIAKGYILGVK